LYKSTQNKEPKLDYILDAVGVLMTCGGRYIIYEVWVSSAGCRKYIWPFTRL